MKLLFGLLILINIAFFLWNTSDNGVNEGQKRQPVHEDQVRLASETDSASAAKADLEEVVARGMPDISPVTAASSEKNPTQENTEPSRPEAPIAPAGEKAPVVAAAKQESADMKSESSSSKVTPPAPPAREKNVPEEKSEPNPEPAPVKVVKKKCYKFGPFSSKSAAEKKKAELAKAGEIAVVYSSSSDAGIKNRYRVYQGTFNTAEMARARRGSLTRKGIKEHFARKDDSGKYFVSLGVFSSRDKADKFVGFLAKKGEKAQVRVEKITGKPVTKYRVKTSACK